MIKELNYELDLYNERADEFDIKENKELITDLIDTLKAQNDKVWLCANEIGENKRAIAVKFGDDVKVFSNPVYQVRDNFELVREKYRDKEYIIPRYKDITLCYQDEEGEVKATKFNEDASPFLSQAMDCLDGIHTDDYGLEVIPEFDKATDEEREQLLSMYINSLKDLEYTLDKDLSSDEETKGVWKEFKFNKALVNGEVQLEKEDQSEKKLNRKQRRLLDKFTKKLKKRGSKIEVS